MIMGARKADIDSIRELKDYIYEKSGVANKSLRALERTGYTEFAYGKAMEFLETEYQTIKFPQAVAKRPTSDLIKQALFLHDFLEKPTRTVGGARAARKAMERGIELLNEMGYKIPTDKERLSRITKVLTRTGVNLTGEVRYLLMESIDQAFDNGYTEDEIEESLNKYQSAEAEFNDVMELFKRGRARA